MGNVKFNKDKYVFTFVPAMLLASDETESIIRKQVSLFLSELVLYDIMLKDLINYPIKEEERNLALNIAYYIMENEELSHKVNRKKSLPIKDLSRYIKIKVSILEKLKDYIIAYYLILKNPEYEYIQNHLKIKLRKDNKVVSLVNKKYPIHKGIALKSFRKSAYILTSTGEFISIRTNHKVKLGELCDGKEKNYFRRFKLPVAIALVVLIFIGCATIIEYKKTQSIIVIRTSSNIKMHVNKFNKVIYAYSPTEKGKQLIASTFIENENFDEAIKLVFEYADEHEMIDKSKNTIIMVTGNPIEYGVLEKTNKYVSENNIPILINNSGTQQSLPEYVNEENNID